MTIVVGVSGGHVTDPEAQWLLDAVDEWRIEAEQPRYDPGWFHASQLGQSDEQLIAQYRGVLDYAMPYTARELRVFDNGRNRDAAWKVYLQHAGLSPVENDEQRRVIINYLRLSGEMDDIVRNPETGEHYVFEFKTMNPYGFGQLSEPKPEHRLQVTCYMAATGLGQALVVYEQKSDQSTRAFYVPFDVTVWDGIADRLTRLKKEAEAIDAAVPPGVLSLSRKLADQLADAAKG